MQSVRLVDARTRGMKRSQNRLPLLQHSQNPVTGSSGRQVLEGVTAHDCPAAKIGLSRISRPLAKA